MRVNHRNISRHISQAEKKARERPWGKDMSPKGPERGAQDGREEKGKEKRRTLTLSI